MLYLTELFVALFVLCSLSYKIEVFLFIKKIKKNKIEVFLEEVLESKSNLNVFG